MANPPSGRRAKKADRAKAPVPSEAAPQDVPVQTSQDEGPGPKARVVVHLAARLPPEAPGRIVAALMGLGVRYAVFTSTGAALASALQGASLHVGVYDREGLPQGLASWGLAGKLGVRRLGLLHGEGADALAPMLADGLRPDPQVELVKDAEDVVPRIAEALGQPTPPAAGSAPGASAPTATATLRMLADAPIADEEEDRLGYAKYAEALAGLIHHPETRGPLTLAINAPWGAGKSSLAALVRQKLKQNAHAHGRRPHVVHEFNAWMHDDRDRLEPSFLASVARAAHRARPWWRRWVNPLPLALRPPEERRRVVVAYTALLSLALAALLVPLVPVVAGPLAALAPKGTEGLVKLVLDLGWLPRYVLLVPFVALGLVALANSTATSLAAFVKDAKTDGAASMARVRRQLGDLVAEATRGGRKLVILVDDLERCRPPRPVDLLETINQFLTHKDVVVVVMADMATVAASAEIKYASVASLQRTAGAPAGSLDYGRKYLQKMVQVQFDLPVEPEARLPTKLPGRDEGPPEKGFRERLVAGLVAVAMPEPLRARTDGAPSARLAIVDALLLPFRRVVRWGAALAYHRSPAAALTRFPSPSGPVLAALRFFASIHVLSLYSVFLLGFNPFIEVFDTGQFNWTFFLLTGTGVALSTLAAGGLLAFAAALSHRVALSRQVRRFQARLDEAREKGVEAVQAAAAGSGDDLPKDLRDAIVRVNVQTALLDDEALLEEASREVLKHFPPLPRNQKRLQNRFRLLLFLAQQRNVYGGPEKLAPVHVAKWAVLQERCPEVATAVFLRPSLAGELEAAADLGQPALQALLLREGLAHAPTGGLLEFLKDPPRLKDVMPRLAGLRAHKDPEQDAAKGPNGSGAASASAPPPAAL